MKITEIVRALGKRRKLIEYVLQENGFNPNIVIDEHEFTQEDFGRIEHLTREYTSPQALAKELGVDVSNLHRYAKEIGLSPLVFSTQTYFNNQEKAQLAEFIKFVKIQHEFTTLRNLAAIEKLDVPTLEELAEKGKLPFIKGRYSKWVMHNNFVYALRDSGYLKGRYTNYDEVVQFAKTLK